MDFTTTDHAAQQMARRNVTDADIDAVLSNPRWMRPTTRNVRYEAIVDGERLAVVVAERERTSAVVVTVFWPDFPGGRRPDR